MDKIGYYRVKVRIGPSGSKYRIYYGLAHNKAELFLLIIRVAKKDGFKHALIKEMQKIGTVDFAPDCFYVGSEPNNTMFVGLY